jgi:hypothetical protein
VVWSLVRFAAAAALLLTLATARPSSAQEAVLWTRVTFYDDVGQTASGSHTGAGVAACSDWLPFGTQLRFEDGRVVTCQDRGRGDQLWNALTGWDAWVDVWVPSWQIGVSQIERRYGLSTGLTVVRWGLGDAG